MACHVARGAPNTTGRPLKTRPATALAVRWVVVACLEQEFTLEAPEVAMKSGEKKIAANCYNATPVAERLDTLFKG